MNNDAKELLEILNNTKKDVVYLRRQKISISSTYNILRTWILVYGLTSFIFLFSILFIQPRIASQNYELFSAINRFSLIVLHLACIIAYLLALKFNTTTLWERERLLILTPIIIMLSVSQMLYPLSYYIPQLYMVYNIFVSLSFDLWLCLVAITILYTITHNKNILIVLSVNILYLVINLLIMFMSNSISYDNELFIELFIIFRNISLVMNQTGLATTILMTLSTYFIRKEVKYETR